MVRNEGVIRRYFSKQQLREGNALIDDEKDFAGAAPRGLAVSGAEHGRPSSMPGQKRQKEQAHIH